MRQLLTIAILLGLAGPTAYAGAACPFAPEGGGGGIEASAITPANCPKDPPEPRCPATFPRPTNANVCACKTVGLDINVRCNNVPQPACSGLIQNALDAGLITADAQTWLVANGWCPIVIAGALSDLCHVGCFEADTQILVGMTSDGDATYKTAAQIAPHDPLLTLSDEAGLDAVDLVSRPVSRVVYGPEEPPLFAFALSNGATLRVTSHHPIVLDTGVIVEAAAVEPGAVFVGVDGQPVKVTAITRPTTKDDVFNFETNGDSQLSHVMAAEGVLLGDLKLQDELAGEEKLIAIRR